MALPLFAITLFCSAFILFLVQPIIGKTILPKLGGTPQVWNTCMVFFQTVLLLGYFYTHASSTRLRPRAQLILHSFLLFIPFVILLPAGPFNIQTWIPELGANPLFSTLKILLIVVGIPFFVVSTSAPLLQKWFGATGHPAAKDPYFLYGASNLGSLLALVIYPFFIEQFLNLEPQKWLWTVGYGVLVVLFLACVALVWKPAGAAKLQLANVPVEPSSEASAVAPPVPPAEPETGVTATPPAAKPAPGATAIKRGKPPMRGPGGAPEPEGVSIRASDEMTTMRRLRWIGLAAIPSSLMLGVTTHITTDLSPIPLFWVVPLMIYLLSFILVFSKWPVPWVGGPHTAMLYIQPALVCLMVFFGIIGPSIESMWAPIFFDVLGFGATALVCHGELAKDRPSTKHLTEFYLLMSVGGMLGGLFNGIIAPVILIYVWEFPIAIICACILRPRMKDAGWADELLAGYLEPAQEAPARVAAAKGAKGHVHRPALAGATAGESTSRILDVGLPIALMVLALAIYFIGGAKMDDGSKYALVFGIPLAIATLFYGRPLRLALSVAGVLVLHGFVTSRGDPYIYADRSYYGILRVKRQADSSVKDGYTTLIHGRINHGMCIFKPESTDLWSDPTKNYTRLATTYYHRLGPAGQVMENYNWFKGPENTYWADARMPVSLIGQAALPLGTSVFPVGQLVDLWSEPPYATIGLGTGTMASYGRPYQHVHYYEIDNHVRRLSLPLKKDEYYFTYYNMPEEPPFIYKTYDSGTTPKPKTYFNFLKEAVNRGSEVEVLMGDARLRMALPYKNHHEDPKMGGGPQNFYHMLVVDAFSSDAIPVHLITKQALEMYFEHMAPDGIVCIHTSNRYVDLPRVVAAVATDLKLSYQRGRDDANKKEKGHFTSEWVMVAKKYKKADGTLFDPLSRLRTPPNYQGARAYWSSTPDPDSRFAWTDDHSNLINVLRLWGND